MKKNICILGSTGSIGTQTLDIIRSRSNDFKVVAISGNQNIDLLYNQALEFKPKYVVVTNENSYEILKAKLAAENIKVLLGLDALEYICCLDEVDIVVTAVVGMIGLKPTVAAIRANKRIALANKETLVAGGEIIKKELAASKSAIIPVDSEHSALFQCLTGEDKASINKLILTASGGPFRGYEKNDLKHISPEEALKHPKWNMGRKISIDSATLFNKALEVIEAHYLYDVPYEQIDVVVHKQSIVHSMVEYMDGSIIAQLGNTDMRHPIQYALDYPKRTLSSVGFLDLIKNNTLNFEAPDKKTFRGLELGYIAGKIGGSMPLVLNAANEEAVGLFLERKISFLEITSIVESVMNTHKVINNLDLDQIFQIESRIREEVTNLCR